MSLCLAEVGVAVIGGDGRQVMVAEALSDQAAWVKVFGLAGARTSARLFRADSMEEALSNARVVLLPINGVNSKGRVRSNCPHTELIIDQSFFPKLETDTLLVTGSLPSAIKSVASSFGVRIFEYAELDEIAIPNAIPTAEGAIQLMMENTGYTIDGSNCLVLGYGRVSKALVKRLLCLGAKVTVAARNPGQRQAAVALGCGAIPLTQLAAELKESDLVINTIPALVLTAGIISTGAKGRSDLFLLDLASSPGGADFAVAEQAGIKALLALGLPGKVAPKTAGKILASNLPGLIDKELNRF